MLPTSTFFFFLLILLVPLATADDDQRGNCQIGLIIVLIITCVVSIFIVRSLWHCCLPPSPTARSRHISMFTLNPNPNASDSPSSTIRSSSLDPSVISSFPTLRYSHVKHLRIGESTLQCAICLSDFEDADTIRLLTHCSHAFHLDCIDMWLYSHFTCPVCRQDLTLPPEGTGRLIKLWRSRTTAAEQWGKEERERFMLRLPDGVRREIVEGKLRRSRTVAAAEVVGLEEGRCKARKERAGVSDSWVFLVRHLSRKFSRRGGGEEGQGVGRVEGDANGESSGCDHGEGGKDRGPDEELPFHSFHPNACNV